MSRGLFDKNSISASYQPYREISTPAAMAEPMTPATLGPMACISRKLPGLYFWPTIWDTRAAIGTADTPAEPMRGIDLLLEEQVHELGQQDAAGGAEAEGHHAHEHDLDGLEGQEGGAGGRCADADAKEDGDDVDELILNGLAQPLRDAALLKEVAQHEAGNEGGGRGTSSATKMVTTMGKMIFSFLLTSRRAS